eukprot:c18472_g1_i1.p2 GENE.c18472_g1_i1~~c18472_g1_i1.p2  ORF type:complete len:118 (+),score=25.81 c18472_g1_i1:366-719(+)
MDATPTTQEEQPEPKGNENPQQQTPQRGGSLTSYGFASKRSREAQTTEAKAQTTPIPPPKTPKTANGTSSGPRAAIEPAANVTDTMLRNNVPPSVSALPRADGIGLSTKQQSKYKQK